MLSLKNTALKIKKTLNVSKLEKKSKIKCANKRALLIVIYVFIYFVIP